MKRRILVILAVFCLLSGCASQKRLSQPSYPSPAIPVNGYDSGAFRQADSFLVYEGEHPSFVGVDVSAYQGEIDWQAVAAAGVDFAIIRVGLRGYTEGKLYEDSFFRQNMEGALAAGLDVGVYFFSQAVNVREALEEAAFVLERIRDYELTYPVVFDWERQTAEGSRTARVSGRAQTNCAVAFCSKLERAGYLPMVYASPAKAYGELDLSRLTGWPFWLAHYTGELQPTGFRYHYDIWQYTSTGHVDGISTPVDLNLCLTDFSRREDR